MDLDLDLGLKLKLKLKEINMDEGNMVTPNSKTLDDHLDSIAKVGYTVVENAIDSDLLDELNRSLLSLEEALGIKPGANVFEGHKTIRIYNLLAHQMVFQKVPTYKKVLDIIEGVLDKGCLISSLSSISIDPGEIAQPIHVDDALIGLSRPHKAVVCNSMWALTDFTEENGATRIIPESHHWEDTPEYGKSYETIAAEMSKGSVLIWPGSLWHGGGANLSNKRRVGIAMNYCAGFIRQQENQQLGLSQELVSTFSDRLIELVGYGTYRGLIGHINKKSPAQVILEKNEVFQNIWDGSEKK